MKIRKSFVALAILLTLSLFAATTIAEDSIKTRISFLGKKTFYIVATEDHEWDHIKDIVLSKEDSISISLSQDGVSTVHFFVFSVSFDSPTYGKGIGAALITGIEEAFINSDNNVVEKRPLKILLPNSRFSTSALGDPNYEPGVRSSLKKYKTMVRTLKSKSDSIVYRDGQVFLIENGAPKLVGL